MYIILLKIINYKLIIKLNYKLFKKKTRTASQRQSPCREGANAKLNLNIGGRGPLTCVKFTDNPPVRASNQQLYL
jgi:hypothetical protein